jgi:hypothetical protein
MVAAVIERELKAPRHRGYAAVANRYPRVRGSGVGS